MLKEKNILITGCKKGIGRAIVEKAASEGANIWACARSKDEMFESDMASLAQKHHVIIEPVYFDLNNENEIKEAVRKVVKEHRPIDGLINNAGIAYYEKLQMMRIEKAKEIFDNNYFSSLYLTQLLARRITKGSGSVVFISSVAAFIPEIGNIAYGGSKIAISHAARILAAELGQEGIRVNAVAPGLVETSMKSLASEESWQQLTGRTALKRSCKPEEIANVVCFLASNYSSYITGQTIHVDGGMT